ncbi:PaaI family thioesterase [Nitratifractor sp.]|uniref:PaaI family thioesterase n=1 Tax=Nitratifractor sp. TaxID=2268144 RepID=UPI0025F05EFC|nr:PaaI family thioesterase [Nitratifractor sp.]
MQFEELDRRDRDFLSYIGGELMELGEGHARLAFAIRPHHMQHLGVVHGGAIATLADHCGWYAVISQLDPGYTSVTIELKINYLKPASGERLQAEAKVINRTRRTAFATIEIFVRETLVAFATATYSIVDEERLKNRITHVKQ